MKNNGSAIINIVIVSILFLFIGSKYNNLRIAYQKSEKEKVEYCEKYYEQSNVIEDLEYEIQMQDTVIEFLNDDNQILSSFLGEMELKQNK
jgi:hypothetical protein